jgi:hypothetical protein
MALLVGSPYITAWTGPTDNPAEGNVAAPINVGTTDQVKDGGLGVTNFVADNIISAGTMLSSGSVTSNTKMRSPMYCDENGSNCFFASTVSSLPTTTPISNCALQVKNYSTACDHSNGGGAIGSCLAADGWKITGAGTPVSSKCYTSSSGNDYHRNHYVCSRVTCN